MLTWAEGPIPLAVLFPFSIPLLPSFSLPLLLFLFLFPSPSFSFLLSLSFSLFPPPLLLLLLSFLCLIPLSFFSFASIFSTPTILHRRFLLLYLCWYM